jgi:hypothetical protein
MLFEFECVPSRAVWVAGVLMGYWLSLLCDRRAMSRLTITLWGCEFCGYYRGAFATGRGRFKVIIYVDDQDSHVSVAGISLATVMCRFVVLSLFCTLLLKSNRSYLATFTLSVDVENTQAFYWVTQPYCKSLMCVYWTLVFSMSVEIRRCMTASQRMETYQIWNGLVSTLKLKVCSVI